MKYAWIELHSRQWPVSLTCQVLGVSPSGYHARKARDVDTDRPRRRISNDALLVHIKAVHAESKGEYGWPRVWKQLLAQGIRVSKDRVQRLMKLHKVTLHDRSHFYTFAARLMRRLLVDHARHLKAKRSACLNRAPLNAELAWVAPLGESSLDLSAALEELQTKCASDVARVLCGEKPIYPVKM